MRKIDQTELKNKAKELLAGGYDKILGWRKDELGLDVRPSIFRTTEDIEQNFVYNELCSANLSKYLVKEAFGEGKTAAFLKPCDTFSFNQLLTEHRIDREKVYVVALACDGMLDAKKIAEKCDSAVAVKREDDYIHIETLFDETLTFKRQELLSERCLCCKSKKPVCGDCTIGEIDTEAADDRFLEVEKIEQMPIEQRFDFWQKEFSRCIRCNACRDVCPACTCEKCVFDTPLSGFENKDTFVESNAVMFHIIRAFHVAGRCTDCGECTRVCPQSIPLHLLNRKLIKDINAFYGEYRAGEEAGSRSPLIDYQKTDPQPDEILGGNENV